MIASLAMYDWPELRADTDAWWAGLGRHLRAAGFRQAPDSLDRSRPVEEQWRSDDLLFTQTCGYPLTHGFHGRFELLGTPCYLAPGCVGPTYSSAIVVKAASRVQTLEDLRGGVAAFNSADSLSGHLALRRLVAPLSRQGRFFDRAIETGSHARSMELVDAGAADIAAIDCVSFALAGRIRPDLVAPLRLLTRSPPAPALPYVTRKGRPAGEVARLRRALIDAVADPALAKPRAALLIGGIELLTEATYLPILALEAEADGFGYTDLA